MAAYRLVHHASWEPDGAPVVHAPADAVMLARVRRVLGDVPTERDAWPVYLARCGAFVGVRALALGGGQRVTCAACARGGCAAPGD